MQTTGTDSETRTAQQDDNALFELGARLVAVEAEIRELEHEADLLRAEGVEP